MFPAEADKQANNCAGKVCPMELENWVQTSHSKPGSGHRVASNSGRVDTGQVVAAAATKLLESFQDDARGFRKQAAVDVFSYVGTQCHVECRSM